MENLLRAVVIAGASVVTVWWLLPDFAEREQDVAPVARAQRTRDARLQNTRPDIAPERAASDDDSVAAVPVAIPVAGEPSIASAIVAGGTVEPIPMIEGITLPGGLWNLHTSMEREPRDAVWADDMERQFSAYFASKPELGRNFSQPSILCRSHFCEIQAVGYGPRAFDTWKTATADLRDQPWASRMRGGGIYTVERAPNEQAVVLILMRPWIQRDDRVDIGLTPPASK